MALVFSDNLRGKLQQLQGIVVTQLIKLKDKKSHDLRLVILFCGFGLLYLLTVLEPSVPDEPKLSSDCFFLGNTNTGLQAENCSGEINKLGGVLDRPDDSVFYFKPVPINRASSQLLQTVTGVGPKLAQNIIEYKKHFGPLVGLESLQKLPGVGVKRSQYLVTQFTFDE